MVKRGNVHKAKKRAKERSRQKKQEEKRQRRHSKKVMVQPDVQETVAAGRDEEQEG